MPDRAVAMIVIIVGGVIRWSRAEEPPPQLYRNTRTDNREFEGEIRLPHACNSAVRIKCNSNLSDGAGRGRSIFPLLHGRRKSCAHAMRDVSLRGS